MADPGPSAGNGAFLSPLLTSVLTAAGIMAAISFILLPLGIRFILTPLLFRKIRKRNLSWDDELSRTRSAKMAPILKKRLMSSERMNPLEDMKALIEVVSPADAEGIIHLNFTPLRFLEIMLMGYEDIYNRRRNSRLLRYLLTRKISWYRPFRRSIEAGRMINSFGLMRFLNRKGIIPQFIRLALIPVLGIPGILFYSIRSLLLRFVWEGFIRNLYSNLLARASQYLIYLYGGECREIEIRKSRFSRKEIVRKGRHYDRELTILPLEFDTRQVLPEMVRCYDDILLNAGLTPDAAYSLKPDAHRKRVRFGNAMAGLLRKTVSAVHNEFASGPETPPLKDILVRMCGNLASINFPGRDRPLESYRLNQILSAAYKLSIISLSAVYSNAPGSRLAMEKISVDLFRRVRQFTKQPLITLLASRGMDSWKSIRPVLKVRKLLKMRKVSPAGVAGLGIPLLGRMLQDKGREILLYRIGRALIRYTVMEEKELPDP